MNPTRIATLVGAAILTVVAAIGSIGGWAYAPFLRTATIGAWTIFAILTGTDRVIAAIIKLRTDITTYGDQRNSDGIIDGLNRAVPAQPTIRGLR